MPVEEPAAGRDGNGLKLRIGVNSQGNSDTKDNNQWESHRVLVFVLPATKSESTCSFP